MGTILNIVESAYRATLEEQDDTVLWLIHQLANNGADVAVLLCGHAVNYAARGQDAALAQGALKLSNPPRLADDLSALMEKRKVPVYFVEDDAVERGLERSDLVAGVEPIARAGLPKLLAQHDQVWHW